MLPCLIVLVLLLICPSAGQLSGQPLTKGTLKTELLANLNKHSDSEEEKLEMWSAGAPPPATTTPINLFGAPRIFEPPFSLTNQPPGGKENPMKPTKPKAPPLLSTGFRFEPTVSAPNVGMPLSPEHADDIRNWRQRFYKIFKNRAKAMKKKVAREPPKVVVHMNDTTQPQIDKNFQVLMARKDPSWLSEDKVKAFARDKKGHIIRLFGVESSGYRYNFTQPELPQASYQSMYPQSQGPVYIPAANLPTQPSLQPAKYEEASVHTVTSRAPTSFKSYMTQTPEPIRLLSVFAPTTMAPTLTAVGETSDSMLTSEVDASPDYNNPTVEQQSDCTTGQCDNDQGGESHEKCNSARLQAIIQNNIVPGDAEASKRAVQTQAELELSQFFNVVCGTGFFSYIAHTDEFCQASSGGVNCYAFSPVCSLRPGPQAPVAPVPQVAPTPLMGLGALSPMPMGLPFGKARKKAVVNRN